VITCRPLRPDDWPVVEVLFGPRGACGGCWCTFWRHPGQKAYEQGKGDGNRDLFHGLVASGRATGVIAYDGDTPVGWCAVAPRADLARVVNGRALKREAPPGTWSVHCFYIPAKRRGQGVATALLEAATAYAFSRGATEVEAYPVTPKADRMPAAFAYTGVPAMFERAGYTPLTREGRAIWVARSA